MSRLTESIKMAVSKTRERATAGMVFAISLLVAGPCMPGVMDAAGSANAGNGLAPRVDPDLCPPPVPAQVPECPVSASEAPSFPFTTEFPWPAPAGKPAGGATETWTFLFYDDADFLDAYDPLVHFSREACSGDFLNVLVLRDGERNPAEVYHIGDDHTITMLEQWGEVNMGDYRTLRDFIAFGKTHYPADHYIMAFYDHGMAWEGACVDVSSGNDWLTMDEFQRAFAEAGGVEIVCFTAPCLMGAVESVFELRNHVDVYVGSEATSGFIYWRGMIGDLCDLLNTPPQPTAIEIGSEIIRLIEENNHSAYGESMTMSAIRTDRLEAARVSLDRLSEDLLPRLPSCAETLCLARSMSKHFNLERWHDRYELCDVDIIDFAECFAAVESDPVLLDDLQDVAEAFGEAVVAETHGSGQHGARGLTLYFPCDERFHNADYETSGLDFASESGWDELLAAYYDHVPIRFICTGPGPAPENPPLLRFFDAASPVPALGERMAYGVPSYGVNVAAGDLYGGNLSMAITGPGPGAVFGPHVRAFTPLGTTVPGVSFLAYGTHKYGVNVASGNVDGSVHHWDWDDDIVTGPGPGAVFGPHVRGWNFKRSGAVVPIPGLSFFAYGTHKFGVNVACGNLDGGYDDEIVTGAGPGAVFGPHVRGWKYDADQALTRPIPSVSFLAYGTHQYGVNVACGDLDGDTVAEIITAPGPGAMFGTHIRAWSYDGSQVIPLPDVNFLAYPSATFGAEVTAADLDLDGSDEIITVPGPDAGWGARVLAWNVESGTVASMDDIDFDAYADLGLTHGGTVAGGVQ